MVSEEGAKELLDWLLLRHYKTKIDKRGGSRITYWITDEDYEALTRISPKFKIICREIHIGRLIR